LTPEAVTAKTISHLVVLPSCILAFCIEAQLTVSEDTPVVRTDQLRCKDDTILSLEAYGVRIGIGSNDVNAIEQIQSRLPPGWEPCPASEVTHWFSLVKQHSCATSRLVRMDAHQQYELFVGQEQELTSM